MSNTIPTADSFISEFATIYADVQDAISHAQQMFTRQANKHRKAYVFSPDYVMLCIENCCIQSIDTNTFVKFAPRFYDPFKVIEKINDVAYHLSLPSH